jgi:hypothetical protein
MQRGPPQLGAQCLLAVLAMLSRPETAPSCQLVGAGPIELQLTVCASVLTWLQLPASYLVCAVSEWCHLSAIARRLCCNG